MKDYCKSCKHDNDIGYCDKCLYNHILEERNLPPTEYEAKPTNADKIRAMSDEELAEAFANQCAGRVCHHGDSCKDCWLDWLRQEASE